MVTVGLVDPSVRLKTVRTATVSVQIVPAPLEHKLHGRPVHLRNLATNLTAEAAPATVDVTIRGSRDALSRVEADDIAAYVDLAGLGAGQYSLTVRADPSLEAGVTHVEPATVQVRIFRDKK
jgi:YbbR domain-containing protein